MMKWFRQMALTAASAGALAAFGGTRSLSGLEGALALDDATNGGFWDVAARVPVTVHDGEASLGAAVDTSGGSAEEFWMQALDARAFTWGESEARAIRTDPFIGLRIILH